MTPDQQQAREIEAGERWLSAQLADDRLDVDVEAIKRSVGIALDEQWLADRIQDDAPGDLAGSLKQRVREEIRSRSIESRGPVRFVRLARWSVGGLAAAAAVALAVVGLMRPPAEAERYAQLDAFEQYDLFREYDATWLDADMDKPLAMLDEQILEYEEDAVDSDLTGLSSHGLDDLRDDLDTLGEFDTLTEFEDEDWS